MSELAGTVIVAPGRKGFGFLQQVMERLGIAYVDNVVDVVVGHAPFYQL